MSVRSILMGFVALFGVSAGSPSAVSAEVLLSDGVSEASVDTIGTLTWRRSPNGSTGDHSFFHSWWYRVGDTGGELAISKLKLVDTVLLDGHAVRFEWRDFDNRFRLANSYNLFEVGDKSVLEETIVIKNLTTDTLDLHLLLLSRTNLDINLSLEGPLDYDSAAWVDARTILQTSPWGSRVSSQVQAGSTPDRYQIGAGQYFFFPPPIRYEGPVTTPLLDTLPTDLEWETTVPSFLNGRPNLEWAWQWNTAVPSEATGFVDVLNRLSVPEPPTMALLLLLLPGVAGHRRSR